jgi:WD40 repeat protein
LQGQRAPITALAFDPASSLLASAGFQSSDVWLWQVANGQPWLLLPGVAGACSIEALAFQPHGDLLAIGAVDWMAAGDCEGLVLLWDLSRREIRQSIPHGATALAFHPGGRRLAIAGRRELTCVLDVATGEIRTELVGHDDRVNCVTYSPGGRWIATGSDDRSIRLWDAETGEERGVAELDTQIRALAFTPDGRKLVSGNASTSCYLLDVGRLLL